jgi:hypothetical protein
MLFGLTKPLEQDEIHMSGEDLQLLICHRPLQGKLTELVNNKPRLPLQANY